MTDDTKPESASEPREFWIVEFVDGRLQLRTSYVNPITKFYRQNTEDVEEVLVKSVHHVIDKSAYDRQEKTIEELELLAKASVPWLEMILESSGVSTMTELAITDLISRINQTLARTEVK